MLALTEFSHMVLNRRSVRYFPADAPAVAPTLATTFAHVAKEAER